MSGWIKLHRSLLEWEWYEDAPTKLLLIHLLVSVNYEDKKWRMQDIKAGSFITSWEKLSEGCGLSVKQCRRAMKNLENSGEVSRITTNKWQHITLRKWDKLQGMKETRADKGQTKGRQRATTKEREERKKYIPAWEEFKNFCVERKPKVDINDLKLKYLAWVENDWRDGNDKPIKNWKSKATNILRFVEEKKGGAITPNYNL